LILTGYSEICEVSTEPPNCKANTTPCVPHPPVLSFADTDCVHNAAMHDDRPRPYPIAAIASLILVALIVRALVAAPPACISKDGTWFIEMAHKLADEPVRHMQIETKQPGLSWVYLVVGRITGHMSTATTPIEWQNLGVWIAVLCGAGVCGLIFELTRQLFDAQTALVAGLFAAVWPQGVELSADALSDMPHLLLYLGVTLLVAARGNGTGERAIRLVGLLAAGFIGGLAYWIRLEAIGLLAAVVCWHFLLANQTWKGRLARCACFGMGFLIPFFAFAALTGRLLFVKTPTLTMLEPDALPRILQWAHTFPLWQTPGRIVEAWAKSGRYILALFFFVAVFWKAVPRGENHLKQLCAWLIGWHLLLVLARVSMHGELSTRYLVIPAALTIPWAAEGYVALVRYLATRTTATQPRNVAQFLIVGMVLVAAPMVPYLMRPINSTRLPYREAGLWLAQHAAADEVIIASDVDLKQAQFYAGRMYPNNDNWRIGNTDSLKQDDRAGRHWWITFIESTDGTNEPTSAPNTDVQFDHVFTDKNRPNGKQIGVRRLSH